MVEGGTIRKDLCWESESLWSILRYDVRMLRCTRFEGANGSLSGFLVLVEFKMKKQILRSINEVEGRGKTVGF